MTNIPREPWTGPEASGTQAKPYGNCPLCDGAMYTGTTHQCSSLRIHPVYPPPTITPLTPPAQQGWICPVCGAGNAPWMPTCGRCPSKPTIVRQTPLA